MKSLKSKFIVLTTLLILCLCIPSFIQASDILIQIDLERGVPNTSGSSVVSGDYQYRNLDDGTIILEKYNGTESNLVIPNTIDGKEITIIDGGAFKENSSIVTVTLPETVLYVDSYAFSRCDNLTTVKVPESVLKINTSYNYCPKFEKFEIPDTLTDVGSNVYINAAYVTVEGTYNYDLARECFEAVNEERAKEGLNALEFDLVLTNEAMERAGETSIYWSHDRPNTTDCFTISDKMDGENLGVGTSSVTMMMKKWMNSWGHKRQIMNEEYNSIGIGVFQKDGVTYWVQTFSKDAMEEEVNLSGKRAVEQTVQVANGWGMFDLTISGLNEDNTIKVGETLAPTEVKMKNEANNLTFYTDIYLSDLTWKSSNTDIFTVDSEGNIIGKSAGTAKLTVSIGTYSEEYNITVEEEPILKGDVNKDGSVTLYDAIKILRQAILGGNLSSEDLYIMDYNDDGKVALYDSIKFLRQAILGQ